MCDNHEFNNEKYFNENNLPNCNNNKIDAMNLLFTSKNFKENKKIIIDTTEYKIQSQLNNAQKEKWESLIRKIQKQISCATGDEKIRLENYLLQLKETYILIFESNQ